MYIIFNQDGSIKKQILNDFIQQGDNNVKTIFVTVLGVERDHYEIGAIASLPNEDLVTLPSENASLTIDGVPYLGKNVTITSDATILAGTIHVNLVITSNNATLVTYNFYLTINKTGLGANDIVNMTVSEYERLLAALNQTHENYVPYEGALYNVQLGVKYLIAHGLVAPNYEEGDEEETTYSNREITIQNFEESKDYIHTYVFDEESTDNATYHIATKEWAAQFVPYEGANRPINLPINAPLKSTEPSGHRYIQISAGNIIRYTTNGGTNHTDLSARATNQNATLWLPNSNGTLATENYVDAAIEDIELQSDVIDVLGTYADLQNYDTSDVGLNDLIKVIQDSTHDNATTYYRWEDIGGTEQWVFVASEGPYYTQSQVDSFLDEKANKEGPLPEFWLTPIDNLLDFITTKNLNGKSIILNGMIGSFNNTYENNYTFEFEAVGSAVRYVGGPIDLENKTYADIFQTDTYRNDYEVVKHKVNNLDNPNNTDYPTTQAVSDGIQNVMEVAEGRCKTYILSYNDTVSSVKTYLQHYTGTKIFDPDGNDITQEWLNGSYDDVSIGNSSFNNQSAQFVVAPPYGLIIRSDAGTITNFIYFAYNQMNLFKNGYIFLVIETDVPDRWYSQSYNFYRLETSKVDLTNYYTKSEVDALLPTFTSTGIYIEE